MRVIYVIYSSELGGAERSILSCAVGVAQSRAGEVLVACRASTEVWAKAVESGLETLAITFPVYEGVRGLRKVFMVLRLRLLRSGLALGRLIRSQRADLVHANGVKAAVSSLIGAFFARTPLLFHIRDYPRHRLLHWLVCSLAAATIVPSEFIRASLPSKCPRVHVVANGVDEPVPAPVPGAFRRSIGIATGVLLITMVAQIAPWKRHDVFLEAAAIVAQDNANVHYCIAGGDLWNQNASYAEHLHKLAAVPSLVARVTFTGNVADAAEIISDSDILVLPSDREPFGRVILEAWHCGTPVVAADGSGPAELIKDGCNGYLFAAGSADALASKLKRLLSDPSCRARCVDMGRTECKRYSIARHVQATSTIYRSIVA